MQNFEDIQNIRAVFFDMDGTLVDSEIGTEISAKTLLRENNIDPGDYDFRVLHGVTWKGCVMRLLEDFPALARFDYEQSYLIEKLQDGFHHHFQNNLVYIPGVQDALLQASKFHKSAIVTSSNKSSVDYLIDKMNIADQLSFYLYGENYKNSKPDPECYLMAARRAGCDPAECLVFEDSIAGLQAAKNAGMHSIAIVYNKSPAEIAQVRAGLKINDYTRLPENFFENISS